MQDWRLLSSPTQAAGVDEGTITLSPLPQGFEDCDRNPDGPRLPGCRCTRALSAPRYRDGVSQVCDMKKGGARGCGWGVLVTKNVIVHQLYSSPRWG